MGRHCRVSTLLVLLVGAVVGFSPDWNRRDVVGALVGGVAWYNVKKDAVVAAAESAPIAVIGANGRTGTLCVTGCIERGIPVRALTRSGVLGTGSDSSLLSVTACDVKDPSSLQAGVAGCRGVIYAASASKKGGNAHAVDNVGVVAAAEACISNKVPRFVVFTSTAVTRPNSLGYKFTNVLGGIMDEKLQGEQGVIAAYHQASPQVSSYTIIRPGGLDEPKNVMLGPSALEISQGDALAGIVSRPDLAQVAIEAALSAAPNVRNTSFELYYTSSVQPCETRFKTLLSNGEFPRLHGDSYKALFRSIKPDGEYMVPT